MTDQTTDEWGTRPMRTPDPEAPVSPETPVADATPDEDPETFPREYVAKLREESAKYRQRAADRDDLAQRLHTALVAATGRLADPEDLPYAEGNLTDPETLAAAVEDLLARKPHLASRRPVGDVGQGAQQAGIDLDLAGLLRRNAS